MRILFICTGNKFRSMSAELLMRKFLADNKIKNISVFSKGTGPDPEPIFPETISRLKHYGCDTDSHVISSVQKEHIEEADIIISMSKHHQNFIREKFGKSSILFNDLVYGKKEDLPDDYEYEMEHGSDYNISKFIHDTIDYIHDAIPKVYENSTKK